MFQNGGRSGVSYSVCAWCTNRHWKPAEQSQLSPSFRKRLPWDEGRMSQSSLWSVEFRLRVLPRSALILSTRAVRDRSEISAPRASPDAQDAGLRIGPGLQVPLFVGIRSTCLSVSFLVSSVAVAFWERAVVVEVYAERISEEILESSASTVGWAVREAIRRLSSPHWYFDGWFIIFCCRRRSFLELERVGNGNTYCNRVGFMDCIDLKSSQSFWNQSCQQRNAINFNAIIVHDKSSKLCELRTWAAGSEFFICP